MSRAERGENNENQAGRVMREEAGASGSFSPLVGQPTKYPLYPNTNAKGY
jgi:hypothetical protein